MSGDVGGCAGGGSGAGGHGAASTGPWKPQQEGGEAHLRGHERFPSRGGQATQVPLLNSLSLVQDRPFPPSMGPMPPGSYSCAEPDVRTPPHHVFGGIAHMPAP